MDFSEDTQQVLEFLDYLTGNRLRKRDDLGAILETAASTGDADLAADIIFSGKALWTLSRKLKRIRNEEEGAELLQREVINETEKLRSMLAEIARKSESRETIERFEDIYIPQTRGAILNIIDLAHDLAEVKNMQIRSKSIGRDK